MALVETVVVDEETAGWVEGGPSVVLVLAEVVTVVGWTPVAVPYAQPAAGRAPVHCET